MLADQLALPRGCAIRLAGVCDVGELGHLAAAVRTFQLAARRAAQAGSLSEQASLALAHELTAQQEERAARGEEAARDTERTALADALNVSRSNRPKY